MLAGLEGVTPGPWKAIEERHEWSLPERAMMGHDVPAQAGEHLERRIFTTWDHAQLKSPFPVVNSSIGIGKAGEPSIQMVWMQPEDASHIARCDPDTMRSILTELRALRSKSEVVAWRSAVRGIRDTCAKRPSVSGAKTNDALKGIAISQSADLGEIMRVCNALLKTPALDHPAPQEADGVRAKIVAALYGDGVDPGHPTEEMLDALISLARAQYTHPAPATVVSPFVTEANGLEVATIKHDDFSLIEVVKSRSGKNRVQMTIHRTNEETLRTDDISIDLTDEEAAALVAALTEEGA